MAKIPFHIVSGFLGSGKTTLLKRIIERYHSEKKIGIIQNEFAPSGIDGVELRQMNRDFAMLEINKGSVFCVCLLGDFVRSLEAFIDEYRPDVIIIEASGLSDTTAVTEVISAGSLASRIFLASNWCVVDAVNFAKVGGMRQRVEQQLRMADVVVLNKMDLLQSGEQELIQQIKAINPFVDIRKSTFCELDFELGHAAVEKFYVNSVQALPRPDVQSMVIKSGKKVSVPVLRAFLEQWAPKAYRIKGFVKTGNDSSVAVQCTFGEVQIREMEHDFRPTELVALTDKFSLREWSKAFREL